MFWKKKNILTESWKPILNFSSFSLRGCWGQSILLFWKLKIQPPICLDYNAHNVHPATQVPPSLSKLTSLKNIWQICTCQLFTRIICSCHSQKISLTTCHFLGRNRPKQGLLLFFQFLCCFFPFFLGSPFFFLFLLKRVTPTFHLFFYLSDVLLVFVSFFVFQTKRFVLSKGA